MIKRCIQCGSQYDDEKTPLCPDCLFDNEPEHWKVKDIHHIHQNAHAQITASTNRFNAGMVDLIIGLILLVLGGIFLFLSFKYNVQKIRVFSPGSVEFVISVICLSISVVLLTFAIIRITTGLKTKKRYQKIINDTEIKKAPKETESIE